MTGTALVTEAAVPRSGRQGWIRLLSALTVLLGGTYIAWRWSSSVNWSVWWIALALVMAETYSFLDSTLFCTTMWRRKERGEPPPPLESVTVDVLITTYDEPVDLVMATARAAVAIRYPHRTWVLDDGARADMAAAAESLGIGYLVRSEDWDGRPRHAKAGNLNNALLALEGEFVLILDADQIPAPQILDRTLGYFRDPQVALVQTPQWFSNVTESDPLGSQAPLFYGPIQQGKDGWNAAFFCGSNALLRRDALMQLGVTQYVEDVERNVHRGLRRAESALLKAGRTVTAGTSLESALASVSSAAATARSDVAAGKPLSQVTYRFQRHVDQASREVVQADLDRMQQDLSAVATLSPTSEPGWDLDDLDPAALSRLAHRDSTPLAALESMGEVLQWLDVDRANEAQAIMPMATISVTEDMATAMRLHALGWHSVYHHEVLADGLAPEDLGTMLQQRLRWAQGTLQVLLRENPLVQRGLSWGQRLMYFSTMWTYLSGFAAVAYLAAPILFLCFGIRPVDSYGPEFLAFFLPYVLVNQLMFFVVGYGVKTWRGHQYSLALFPLWIKAVTTALGNVVLGRPLGFAVTPKSRGERISQWRFVRPQLIAIALLLLAAGVGVARLGLGLTEDRWGTGVNLAWVLYDLVVLSVVIQAALFRGPTPTPRASDD